MIRPTIETPPTPTSAQTHFGTPSDGAAGTRTAGATGQRPERHRHHHRTSRGLCWHSRQTSVRRGAARHRSDVDQTRCFRLTAGAAWFVGLCAGRRTTTASTSERRQVVQREQNRVFRCSCLSFHCRPHQLLVLATRRTDRPVAAELAAAGLLLLLLAVGFALRLGGCECCPCVASIFGIERCCRRRCCLHGLAGRWLRRCRLCRRLSGWLIGSLGLARLGCEDLLKSSIADSLSQSSKPSFQPYVSLSTWPALTFAANFLSRHRADLLAIDYEVPHRFSRRWLLSRSWVSAGASPPAGDDAVPSAFLPTTMTWPHFAANLERFAADLFVGNLVLGCAVVADDFHVGKIPFGLGSGDQ